MSEAAQMAGDAMSEVGKLLRHARAARARKRPRRDERHRASPSTTCPSPIEGAAAPALDGVTFAAPAASTVALVGPSGSAASPPPRARCRVFGTFPQVACASAARMCADMDPADLMGQVAFVFQNKPAVRAKPGRQRACRATRCHGRQRCLPPFRPHNATTSWRSCRRASTHGLARGGAYLSGGEVQRVAPGARHPERRAHRGA